MFTSPWSRVQLFYDDLWRAVVRPPRDKYKISELGAQKFILRDDKRAYTRTDFTVSNKMGLNICCSHYEPCHRPMENLPCVIYLHGNCSSRLEAFCALPYILPLNITVLGFDFTGSGLSDGEYVTLGWNEQEDLSCVIDYLRESRKISTLGLWGRSMGAVTAILHAQKDATVMGIVADSPFANLRQLAEEMASEFVSIPLPTFLIGGVINMLRNTILHKTQMDINKLDVVAAASECVVPSMYITGHEDNFIKRHHAEALFQKTRGEKWLIEAIGDHNSPRTHSVMFSIALFFYNTLHCETLFEAGNVSRSQLAMWNKLKENCATMTLFSNPHIGGHHTKISEVSSAERDSQESAEGAESTGSQESMALTTCALQTPPLNIGEDRIGDHQPIIHMEPPKRDEDWQRITMEERK